MSTIVIDNIEYQTDQLIQKAYQSTSENNGVDYYTKLLIHANGLNGSRTFLDSSFNNKYITPYNNVRIQNAAPPLVYGNVVLSTSKYKFGTSSAYFDGNGDYLGITDSEDWNFGTGDFTVECWYNPSTLTGSNQWRGLVCQRYAWTSNHAWSLQLDQNNNGFGFCWSLNGSTGYGTPAFGGPLTIGQWYHVCVSRIGDQLYCACNGNVTIFTGTASAYYNSTAIVAIGRLDSGGSGDICGYIDEVRISKGIARYTSNFTPPTQSYESDVYTKLLMHMEGTNNSIGFSIDNWNFTKFSGYIYFDGSGDYLRPDNSIDFSLNINDFTIDLWIWLINGGHGNEWSRIFETEHNPYPGGLCLVCYENENPTRIAVQLSNGQNIIISDSTVSNDSWNHIAIVRHNKIIKLYINGVSQSTTVTTEYFFGSEQLSIGSNLVGGESFLGYIDEFRFSKGIARWTADFTPPTSEYNLGNINLLPFSENNIKAEGSYSLKCIASQNTSLNASLIRNFSPALNLSEYGYIVGKIKSNRTGQNIKISFSPKQYDINNITYVELNYTSAFSVLYETPIHIELFGAGGAGGTKGGWSYGSQGGFGGKAIGDIVLQPGITYYLVVGGKGLINSTSSANGGGGIASINGSDNRYGGGGGGYSGLFQYSVSQENALIIAGGGGGGGSSRAGEGNIGGSGGGLVGENGVSAYDNKTTYRGIGGSQSSAGTDAVSDGANLSGNQSALYGGNPRTNCYGGAGGGGYFGGSAGGYSESNTMGGGGGGSGYLHPTIILNGALITGCGAPGGSPSSNGSDGLVVISYNNQYNIDFDCLHTIPSIDTANTWKAFHINISSLLNQNKNYISQLNIKIINADSDNVFYIDNIFAASLEYFNGGMHVSKTIAYAVITVPRALNISKTIAYAVIQPYINQGFGHIDPQLGSDINNGSSWHNAWRTITGGPTSSRIITDNCLVKIAKSEDPVSIGQAQWIGTKSDTTYKNDEYTNILIRFNEAHNSTSAKETSQNYLDISSNNLLITNAQSKLNSTSGYFNGSSTYVSIPDTELLNFGTEDWTIDFWFCPTGSCSGLYPEIMSTQSGWNNGAIKITWDETDRRLGISCYYSGSGRGWITSYNLNFNQWYHAAYIRIGAYIYVYIDGILTITCPIDESIGFDWCYGGSCRIGGGNWDGSNSYYLGYLSELRVSRYARWTSNFTPPTQPYDVLYISRIILPVALNKLIDDCESAWTASANVTCSVSTTKRIQYYSSLISISANFITGKIAYKQLSSQLDLSSYQKISLFFHSTANILKNVLKICLCSDTSGDIIVNTFILPDLYDMSSTYYPLALTLDAGSSLSNNINSIALYAISDPGTIDIRLDHIIACKSGNSLSLNSVISKNTSNEPWCVVQSIFDNIVYISSYYGQDETVDTYIRQTVNIEKSTDNYIQVSGSNGGVIKYKAGYNKITDQIDGETFYLGRSNSIGLHTNSKSNIYIDKINIMSANTGLYINNSNNCHININNINNYRLPGSNSFYMSGSYNNRISIKNLLYPSPRINISNSDNNIININKHNLPITHSGYNNKLYNTNNIENVLLSKNYFSNSKIFINDFESNLPISNSLSSSTDNTVLYDTRLYRENDQNLVTKYYGSISTVTNIRHTNSGFAWKMFLNTTYYTRYNPLKLSVIKLAIQANKFALVRCWIYRDSPLINACLICERWQLNGIEEDAVSYTTKDSLLNWEELTINFISTQQGVVDIKVYAYGEANYSVYIDDVSYAQVS